MVHDALGAYAPEQLGIPRLSGRVRFRLRWLRLAASPLEQHASLGHCHGPGGGFDPTCLWNFIGVPRVSGRVGCTRGWRRSDDGRNTRHLLGCAGHGVDRRRRVTVRNSCASGANWRPSRLCATSPAYAADGVVTPQLMRGSSLLEDRSPVPTTIGGGATAIEPVDQRVGGPQAKSQCKSLKLAPLASGFTDRAPSTLSLQPKRRCRSASSRQSSGSL
jgi:hypothetical protein